MQTPCHAKIIGVANNKVRGSYTLEKPTFIHGRLLAFSGLSPFERIGVKNPVNSVRRN